MAPNMAQTPSQQPRDVAEILGECPERIQQRRPSIDGREDDENDGNASVPPSAPELPHEEKVEDEGETDGKEDASPPSPATTDNNPKESNSYASLDQADDVGSQASALSVASLGRLAKALETLCAVQAWQVQLLAHAQGKRWYWPDGATRPVLRRRARCWPVPLCAGLSAILTWAVLFWIAGWCVQPTYGAQKNPNRYVPFEFPALEDMPHLSREQAFPIAWRRVIESFLRGRRPQPLGSLTLEILTKILHMHQDPLPQLLSAHAYHDVLPPLSLKLIWTRTSDLAKWYQYQQRLNETASYSRGKRSISPTSEEADAALAVAAARWRKGSFGKLRVSLLTEEDRVRRGADKQDRVKIESIPSEQADVYIGELPKVGYPVKEAEAKHKDLMQPASDGKLTMYFRSEAPSGKVHFRLRREADSRLQTVVEEAADRAHYSPGRNEFTAYDCSVPDDPQIVRPPQTDICDDRKNPDMVTQTTNKTYILLQEAEHTPVTVRRCRLLRNSIPMQCGNYDHQTMLTNDVVFQKPITMSAEECEEIWRTHKVSVEITESDSQSRLIEFEVSPNTTNQMTYTSVGKSWLSSSTEAECYGAKYWSHHFNRWVDDVVEAVNDDLLLTETTGLLNKQGQVLLPDENLILPVSCPGTKGSCVVRTGTYLWSPPTQDETCRFFSLGRTTGTEAVVMDRGEPVTIFNDDQRTLRFELQKYALECGQVIQRTNFQRIFVVEADDAPHVFARQLPLHEQNMPDYTNNKMGWIYGKFTGMFTNHLSSLLKARCLERVQERAKKYALLAAEQKTMIDGATVSLGKGVFATATAETWRRYSCREVTAYSRDASQCYSALPVLLSPSDKERFLYSERRRANNATLDLPIFVEPTTRRLTTIGIPLNCSTAFTPMYQNKLGGWVQLTPAVMEAPTPDDMEEEFTPPTTRAWELTDLRGPNWEETGIYTPDQVTAMNVFSQFPRLMTATAVELTRPSMSPGAILEDRYYSNFLHHVGLPDMSILSSLTNSGFYQFITSYGSVMATLIGTYGLIHLFMYSVRFLYRLLFPRHTETEGFLRVALACWPALSGLLYEYFHRDGQRQQGAAPGMPEPAEAATAPLLAPTGTQPKRPPSNIRPPDRRASDPPSQRYVQAHMPDQEDTAGYVRMVRVDNRMQTRGRHRVRDEDPDHPRQQRSSSIPRDRSPGMRYPDLGAVLNRQASFWFDPLAPRCPGHNRPLPCDTCMNTTQCWAHANPIPCSQCIHDGLMEASNYENVVPRSPPMPRPWVSRVRPTETTTTTVAILPPIQHAPVALLPTFSGGNLMQQCVQDTNPATDDADDEQSAYTTSANALNRTFTIRRTSTLNAPNIPLQTLPSSASAPATTANENHTRPLPQPPLPPPTTTSADTRDSSAAAPAPGPRENRPE
jgi:hypothetical protein